jgi:hypothetical protein
MARVSEETIMSEWPNKIPLRVNGETKEYLNPDLVKLDMEKFANACEALYLAMIDKRNIAQAIREKAIVQTALEAAMGCTNLDGAQYIRQLNLQEVLDRVPE